MRHLESSLFIVTSIGGWNRDMYLMHHVSEYIVQDP